MKSMKIILALFLISLSLLADSVSGSGGGGTTYVTTLSTGACNNDHQEIRTTDGTLNVCKGGTWGAPPGGAASAGGSAGQIQVNSAGSLGGVTIAKDATFATPNLTVTGINGTALSGLATGIIRNTTATGVPVIAVAGDFPTLNQSTTGNAATSTALSATPTACASGNAFLGIAASGASSNCFKVPQTFFGTAAPGSVSGNLPGDVFNDTTNHVTYHCNAASGTPAPACTAVTSGGWQSVVATTATFTSGLPLYGGGGANIVLGSVSGNTSQTVTTTGTQTTNAITKIDASGNHIASTWNIDANANMNGPTGNTGYLTMNGATSGAEGFTVPNVAGTSTLYVLPTAVSSGSFLKDNGSTTCPTLPSGAPGVCEALAWASPAGSGTITASTIGQVPVYTTTTTTLTGSANLTFSGSTLTLGVAGIALGALSLTGNTSGTTTIQPPAVAGGTLTAPASTGTLVEDTATLTAGGILYGGGNHVAAASSAGTAKQIVLSGGAGAPTLIDYPEILDIPAANCFNATGGTGWSIGSGGSVTCRAGSNNKGAYISITDTSTTFATFQFRLPIDWDTASNPFIRFGIDTTDNTSGHTIIPSIQVACYKGDGTTTDDVAPNTAHSLSTITTSTNANQFYTTSNVQMNATDLTGCVAGALVQVTVGRATDTATNALFYDAIVTVPRLLTTQAN